jgi:hypothetical protein
MKLTTISVLLLLLLVSVVPVSGQQSKAPQFKHVTITMEMDGTSCLCLGGVDLSCCPAFVASVDESGIVKYRGIGGVLKIKGERTHSISPFRVRDLVAEFLRIKFLTLEDRYYYKKLPDGSMISIDHSVHTTISVDLDGRQKSILIVYGQPQELTDLRRKLFDALQIGQYVGRN